MRAVSCPICSFYFLSPRHGASSCCGWKRWAPGMEDSYERTE